MPNVLLVDDLKQNLYALERILSVLEIDIDTASSGQEALSLMLDKSYAVVILDVQMPEMDGLEATRQIRQLYTHKPLPIIAITANATVEDRQLCFDAGMDNYVSKPFKIKELAKIIVDAVAFSA